MAGEKDHSAYMSPELFDAALTPLGWKQVKIDGISCYCVLSGSGLDIL